MINERNKIILLGLLVSIVLVAIGAGFAINKIQDELYENYSNFGQLLTRTLAVQSYDLTKGMGAQEKVKAIKKYSKSILSNNKDISFITFRDEEGNILYTTLDEPTKNPTKINISSPITDKKGNIEGSVDIGLSADMASSVTKTTKNSMLMVFTFAWIAFSFILIINALWATRELSVLHQGVRAITGGEFGTTISYNKATGEIKDLFMAFNDMSKRLHQYEEQNIDTLTVEKNKLEAVLMGIANGVVVCDNNDNITLVNNAAQAALNVDIQDILNTQIQNYCDTQGELCFKEQIEMFKNTPLRIMENKPLEFNIQIEKRVIKTIISPMFSKVHDYIGYILILIDITKEAEVDKLKNDFISNVSHELRTPVTILRSYIDTLYSLGQKFSYDEQKDFIGTINQEIVRLNKMVNDILDFSKLQANTKCEKTTQNIANIIEKTLFNIKLLADEKNIKFSVIKEENLPDVPFNEESIERVLTNLITNAIKHSNDNSRIKISAEMSSKPGYIEVTVQDYGCGIATEHLDKIFDRFYRVENDTHTIKGTGLGLHLVKVSIEKQHKGEVFVHSEVGIGSIFGFRLPLCLSEKDQELQQIQTDSELEVENG